MEGERQRTAFHIGAVNAVEARASARHESGVIGYKNEALYILSLPKKGPTVTKRAWASLNRHCEDAR